MLLHYDLDNLMIWKFILACFGFEYDMRRTNQSDAFSALLARIHLFDIVHGSLWYSHVRVFVSLTSPRCVAYAASLHPKSPPVRSRLAPLRVRGVPLRERWDVSGETQPGMER